MADELPHIGPAEPAVATKPQVHVSNDDQPFTAKPFAPLIGFLELGESELTNPTQTQLQEIWDFLGEDTSSELTSERLYALRTLENKLAPPKIGQTRLSKVHSYIQAQRVVKQAEKWRDAHYKRIDDGGS